MFPAIFLIITVTAWVFTVRKSWRVGDGAANAGASVASSYLFVDAVIALLFAGYVITHTFTKYDQIFAQDDLRHYLYAFSAFSLLAVAAVSRAIIPGKVFDKSKIDWLFFLRWTALTLWSIFLVTFLLDRDGNMGSVQLVNLLTNAKNSVMAGDFTDLIMSAFFGMLFVKIVLGYVVLHEARWGWNDPSATPDQVLRGSKLISATDLAAQIRARFSGK